MMVLVMWEPDETCVDPADHGNAPRRHADVMDDDVLVVWRKQSGDPDGEGKVTWHVASMGVFENISAKDMRKAMRKLGVVG